MGHKRQRKILSLTFEDEPGLEIFARSCTVRKFLWMVQLVDKLSAGTLPQDVVDELVEWFAGRIVSWNIEDDEGRPVPVSADYLLDEDIDWAVKVVMGWAAGVLQVFKVPLGLSGLADLARLGQEAQARAAGTSQVDETSIPMQPATPG